MISSDVLVVYITCNILFTCRGCRSSQWSRAVDPSGHRMVQGAASHWLEFTQETSLNGMYFLGRRDLSWPRRLFWLVCVLVAFVGAIQFNKLYVEEFLNDTVLITVKSVSASLDYVHFPAVTVCNNKKVTVAS